MESMMTEPVYYLSFPLIIIRLVLLAMAGISMGWMELGLGNFSLEVFFVYAGEE